MRARTRTLPAAIAFAATTAATMLAPAPAQAGIAWGDASLHGDDVRVEIDATAHARVTHVIGIHVAGKRFKAFVVDAIDEHAEPPTDAATQAGLDGPGWPVALIDAHGEPFEAFVEPAKEPNRLRVHLGRDGVPRGDYTITLQYRVDLAPTIRREGSMAHLTWRAPSWPEGFDSGHLTFVTPSAPTEPRVALVDDGSGEPRSIEGAALLEVHRTAALDELALIRPHVAHHDDARWVLSFDVKAIAQAPFTAPPAQLASPPTGRGGAPLRRLGWASLALVIGALSAAALRRRDLDARRWAGARGERLRGLLPLGDATRAVTFGACAAGSILASVCGRPMLGAAGVVLALVVGALRAPAPRSAARPAGRWLAIPLGSLPPSPVPVRAPFDLGARSGRIAFALGSLAIAACCALLARRDLAWAFTGGMHAVVLLWPFATGGASALPPDLVGGALRRLAPLHQTFGRAFGSRARVVAHVPRGGAPIDEVRLRVAPTAAAAAAGLIDVEVGCALVAGFGATASVPELLMRARTGSPAAEALSRRIAAARHSATFALTRGRDEDERVLAVRPAFASPAALRRWVEWAMSLAERAPTSPSQSHSRPQAPADARPVRSGEPPFRAPSIVFPRPAL